MLGGHFNTGIFSTICTVYMRPIYEAYLPIFRSSSWQLILSHLTPL